MNSFTLMTALLLSQLLTTTATAQIYQSEGPEGNPVFTDQPSAGAKQLNIKQTNTVKAIEAGPTALRKQQPKASVYHTLSIISPRDGSHLANGLVAFNVNISVNPSLKQGHKLQLIINGLLHSTGRGSARQVASIARGEHTLSANIIDTTGTILISSDVVNITAARPSSLINNISSGLSRPSRPSIR